MPSRDFPARPHLDHFRNEAKALRKAFLRGEPTAVERVRSVIGPRTELKLTEAQRVIAREYGFPSWARLRTQVQASRSVDEAVSAFLEAASAGDVGRVMEVLRIEPRVATASVHVAAVLGLEDEVRRRLDEDPSLVTQRAGTPGGDPLLWLCYSPLHGQSADRDNALLATARTLLDAGADPNTRGEEYSIPVLYAVTGQRNVPRIARLLLEAGANPTDGESVFHAAEHFHEEALELLLRFGVDLNFVGDWGNTALYFLLLHWTLGEGEPRVTQGVHWLLDHGADPNVRCGREQESSLHLAARRGQRPETIRLLLDHGADVHGRRADGRTAWILARRGGFDEIATLLENAGALPEPLAPADELMAACGRGDTDAARRLTSPDLVDSLESSDFWILPEAAFRGRRDVIGACIAAGFPIDALDEIGATALHHASIRGRAAIVRDLLSHGADFRIRDSQHHAPPLGWACFGADVIEQPGGDYEDCVRALLEAGARLGPDVHYPEHPGIRELLRTFAGR